MGMLSVIDAALSVMIFLELGKTSTNKIYKFIRGLHTDTINSQAKEAFFNPLGTFSRTVCHRTGLCDGAQCGEMYGKGLSMF